MRYHRHWIRAFGQRSTITALLMTLSLVAHSETVGRFDTGRDLLLAQFDSKTDVDDLHSVAGVATVLSSPALRGVRYHAVAGAYGIQEGLYVPAPDLFDLAFGANWSDAHGDREAALRLVSEMVVQVLQGGGQVWVAEAGQSDFTADWLRRVQARGLDTQRVHVVQHSDWNEAVTTPAQLAWVKDNASYHRIPDGNEPGNGTPNFKADSGAAWARATDHEQTGAAWRLARTLANRYNGSEGRYLNTAIATGGLDFSDVVETCWIFGFEGLEDVDAYFDTF